MTVTVASRRATKSAAKKTDAEKIFVCSYAGCNKSFTVLRNKNRHEKLHLGIKPFACSHPGCTSAFSRNSDLTVHFRSHTGEQPYSCKRPGCSKRFSRVSDLRLHERKHDGVKPFSCDALGCGKSFARPWELRVHQQKMHSKSLCPMKATPRPVFKVSPVPLVPSMSPEEGYRSPFASPVPSDLDDPMADLEGFQRRTEEILAMTRTRDMVKRSSVDTDDVLVSAIEASIGLAKQAPLASPSTVIEPSSPDATHQHALGCGHDIVRHQDHFDFLTETGDLHHISHGGQDRHELVVQPFSENLEHCSDTTCSENLVAELPSLFDLDDISSTTKTGLAHPHIHCKDPMAGDAPHVHGTDCGHTAVPHGDHVDFIVGNTLHHAHDGHCDIHGSVESISNSSQSECLTDILRFLS